jgi:hypothetical protein
LVSFRFERVVKRGRLGVHRDLSITVALSEDI